MDEKPHEVDDVGDVGPTWESAREHALYLRDRITTLAEEIAESEDTVARVYEESARLRPHAAPRLQEGARQAREYAERERRAVRDGELTGSDELPEP